jgi:predicted acetyltransferase
MMQIPVALERTTEQTEHIVKNMFVAYFNDTAPYNDECVINAHGLPVADRPGSANPRTYDECVRFNWWIRDRCELYIVRADGTPAGFVIILTDLLHLPPGVDMELMDFYIMPKYRGRDVGRMAARAAFDLHHGCWQVGELARNAPAIRFWHSVINEYTRGQYENLENGTQQRFRN